MVVVDQQLPHQYGTSDRAEDQHDPEQTKDLTPFAGRGDIADRGEVDRLDNIDPNAVDEEDHATDEQREWKGNDPIATQEDQ